MSDAVCKVSCWWEWALPQLLDVVPSSSLVNKESIEYYPCAVFECGEYSLADFLKKNRHLHDIQKLGILHQLLLAVNAVHNEHGAQMLSGTGMDDAFCIQICL